jgi:hypothetical protein
MLDRGLGTDVYRPIAFSINPQLKISYAAASGGHSLEI